MSQREWRLSDLLVPRFSPTPPWFFLVLKMHGRFVGQQFDTGRMEIMFSVLPVANALISSSCPTMDRLSFFDVVRLSIQIPSPGIRRFLSSNRITQELYRED